MSEEKKPDEEVKPGEAEAKPDRVAELETELEQTRARLASLENKDFNFKKLRDMTEEEMGKLSSMEKTLLERQEKLEQDQSSWAERVVETHKQDALSLLVGTDVELRKKVLHHFDRFQGTVQTREEIAERMRESYVLATAAAGIDPVARANGYSSRTPVLDQKKGDLNADQKDLAAKLGINEDEIKKYA